MSADFKEWQPANAESLSRENAVHIWARDLRMDDADELWELETLLSPDERERAARFHFPQHRERFIVTRATLRQILGGYLFAAPRELRFCYSAHGKPSVDFESEMDVRFNVSHSENLALFAVTSGREVGVDVEWIKPEFPCLESGALVFTNGEMDALRVLSSPERTRAFFTLWSCKEALLKALGEGFSSEPKNIHITLSGDSDCPKVTVANDNSNSCSLRILPIAKEYAAAVATHGVMDSIQFFNSPIWQGPMSEEPIPAA
jgi:4'-phosphopantetheinyl transferase